MSEVIPRARKHMVSAVSVIMLAAAIFLSLALTNYVERASAYTVASFCPTYQGQTLFLAPGSRCVDHRKVNHRHIKAIIYLPTGAGEYCVGAKQYSDGTGGNTEPFGCSYIGLTDYTQTGPSSPTHYPAKGYATIINRTNATQQFFGDMTYY